MRFALLGVDPDALKLVEAIAQSDRHDLVAIYDAPPDHEALRRLAPTARRETDWEGLLHASSFDAVVVAANLPHEDSGDTREEQLRKLTQAAIPLLLKWGVSSQRVWA